MPDKDDPPTTIDLSPKEARRVTRDSPKALIGGLVLALVLGAIIYSRLPPGDAQYSFLAAVPLSFGAGGVFAMLLKHYWP